MPEHFDICIVGAGMAGLSAAVHLTRRCPGVRVVLLDRRTTWGDDRTWSLFDVCETPFDACVAHRWSSWRVADTRAVVDASAAGIHYVHIPSERFYAHALDTLAHTGAEVRGGVHVGALRDGDRHVEVEVDGVVLCAALVLDSRPIPGGLPPSRTRDVSLLQHFVGATVQTDAACFDPSCASLMDFRVDQSDGLGFLYVLPFSETEALIEPTWFTRALPSPDVHETALQRALAERVQGPFRVVRREGGVLPMTSASFPVRPSRRVVRIGLAGGFARPSTGYAFLDAQRWSSAFADCVAAHGVDGALDRVPAPRHRLVHLLDRIFLQWIDREPDHAPALFRGLFERVPGPALVRFLSGVPSATDVLAVMLACPRLSFTREALRGLVAEATAR